DGDSRPPCLYIRRRPARAVPGFRDSWSVRCRRGAGRSAATRDWLWSAGRLCWSEGGGVGGKRESRSMSSLNFVRPTPMTARLSDSASPSGRRERDHFRALRSETSHFTNREMQIAPEQGPFLAMLVRLLGAKYCVEVGAFTGYSSLWIAGALPPEG